MPPAHRHPGWLRDRGSVGRPLIVPWPPSPSCPLPPLQDTLPSPLPPCHLHPSLLPRAPPAPPAGHTKAEAGLGCPRGGLGGAVRLHPRMMDERVSPAPPGLAGKAPTWLPSGPEPWQHHHLLPACWLPCPRGDVLLTAGPISSSPGLGSPGLGPAPSPLCASAHQPPPTTGNLPWVCPGAARASCSFSNPHPPELGCPAQGSGLAWRS